MKALILILVLTAFCGCTEKNEELSVSLGIYEDGMPFWNWKGNLLSEVYVGGKATYPTGSNIRAKFTFQETQISINAIAKLKEDGLYSVTGNYTSTERFSFNLLGAENEEGIEFNFEEGTGEIEYSGTLESTYTKPNR
jgi:hypothetical protein